MMLFIIRHSAPAVKPFFGGGKAAPENGKQRTERAGAKRQTFHGHRARGKRATGGVMGECERFALRG